MKQSLSRSLSRLPMVQPLDRAHNYLLQVLITRFRLVRHTNGPGTRMEVCFDPETPTIWNRQGKDALRKHIPHFDDRARRIQTQLDRFLIEGQGRSRYEFDDDTFPFRYISGGTIPILTIGRRRYYCLFYREVEPIGWNIANGAADNLHELLDPRDTIRREFGEELLIVNPQKKTRYVFEWAENELAEWPGFSVARRLFEQHYPGLNLGECREIQNRPKWEDGPDSLLVSCESEGTRLTTGVFLNINATDFGIEIDRVAKISLDDDAVIFDGEISGNVPIGAPIGLFPVETFNQAIRAGERRFEPSIFFYEAKKHEDAKELFARKLEDLYIPRLTKSRIISREEADRWQAANAAGGAYDLCPVTRSLVRRYLQQQDLRRRTAARRLMRFDYFLSWAAPDEKLAHQIYEYLTEEKHLSVFFSAVTPMKTKFGDDIRAAVHGSQGMIVAGSRPSHVRRVGVMYEWMTFLNDIDDGRKPKNAPIFTFAGNFGYDKLPTQLSLFHVVTFDPKNMRPGLESLGAYLDRVKLRLADDRR